jgi:hypothetical protein
MGTGNSVPDPTPFSAEDCLAADGPAAAVAESAVGAFSGTVDDWKWDGLWISWATQ